MRTGVSASFLHQPPLVSAGAQDRGGGGVGGPVLERVPTPPTHIPAATSPHPNALGR